MNSRPRGDKSNYIEQEGDMVVYNGERGPQALLNAVLGEYHAKGFRLTEPDDHCLCLYYQDERIGVLSQGGATVPVIREACRRHLTHLEKSAV